MRKNNRNNSNDKKNASLSLVDKMAFFIGSWKFVGCQSGIIFFWILFNALNIFSWDPYPFIFLNLALSFQAAFTAPIIMMSQNQISNKDRQKMELDYEVNLKAEEQIEEILIKLAEIKKSINNLKN